MNKIKELIKKFEEIISYVFFGVLTTIVSLGTYYICTVTVFNPKNAILLQIANIISWIAAVTFAYFTNRKYVFKSKESNKFKEASKFYISRLATLFLDMSLMLLFVSIFKINDKIAKLIVQILIVIGNYIISKFIVFSKMDK